MLSAATSSHVPNSRSVFAKRMKLLSQIITPKPKLRSNAPRTAYMFKKSHRSKPKSGAARISAEKRFVQGLGYIRADATPVRSRATKPAAASERNSYPAVLVEATDLQVCSELIALSEPEAMHVIANRPSRMSACLYSAPRLPSTMTQF